MRPLSTSFRNAGRVLEAAAVLQAELRAQAPDVPVLAPAPDRGGRGAVCCALLPAVTDEAEWVAGQAAALLALPAGSAPDGQPWPDGGPPGCARRTSRCCAGSGPSSCRCAGRSRRAASRARWSGSAACCRVPEVQDVVATLRVLHDAAASDALARLLTGPRWRIGPRDLVALGRRARDLAAGRR